MQDIPVLTKDGEEVSMTGEGIRDYEKRIDIKMLLNNRISGLLPLRIQFVDEKCIYSYPVQGLISLEELLRDKKLDFFLAERIYGGILSAWRRGQEFFLTGAHFVLDPSCLFWDDRKKKVMICYFPGFELSLDEQMTALGQFLLERTEHNDKQCVSFVYGIYELIEREGFVNADIDGWLEGCKEEERKRQDRERRQEKGQTVRKKRNQKPEAMLRMRKLSKWKGLPELVDICKDSFTVGRSQENDFVIPAMWVSFHHARIDRKQSQVYVTDSGSTNGVYLNGKRLLHNHPVLCRAGDIISFADIAYCLEEI